MRFRMIFVVGLITLLVPAICTQTDPQTRVLAKTSRKNQTEIHDGTYNDFEEFLRNTRIYIDKTLLLRKVLVDEKQRNLFISAPQRWGKTINLKMIEFFLGIQLSTNHTLIPAHQTSSYKFFTSGEITNRNSSGVSFVEKFDNLPLISNFPDLIASYTAQYPVIYLDFSQLEPVKTFEEFIKNFKAAVSQIYQRFVFVKEIIQKEWAKGNASGDPQLYESGALATDLDKFNGFQSNRMTDDHWVTSISTLCKLINRYFEKKVIVLLDELDFLLRRIYFRYAHHIGEWQRNRISKFLLNFVNDTFTDSGNIEKCIATGMFPVIMKDATSGADEFVYLNYVDNEVFPFYGFTESEFRQLASLVDIPYNSYTNATDKYGGYFADKNFKVTILNPLSVTRYVNTLVLANHWIEDSSTSFEYNIEIDEEKGNLLCHLMYDRCVPYPSKPSTLPLSVFVALANSFKKNQGTLISSKLATTTTTSKPPISRTEGFLWYLLTSGFVSKSSQNNSVCLRIPNEEMKTVVCKVLVGGYNRIEFGNEDSAARSLMQLVDTQNSGAADQFVDRFKDLLKQRVLFNLKFGAKILHNQLIFHLILVNLLAKAKKLDSQYQFEAEPPIIQPQESSYFIKNSTYLFCFKGKHGTLIGLIYDKPPEEVEDVFKNHMIPYGYDLLNNTRPQFEGVSLVFINVKQDENIQHSFQYLSMFQ